MLHFRPTTTGSVSLCHSRLPRRVALLHRILALGRELMRYRVIEFILSHTCVSLSLSLSLQMAHFTERVSTKRLLIESTWYRTKSGRWGRLGGGEGRGGEQGKGKLGARLHTILNATVRPISAINPRPAATPAALYACTRKNAKSDYVPLKGLLTVDIKS